MKLFVIENFPVELVEDDGRELWVDMPNSIRYRFRFLQALAENICWSRHCDPVQARFVNDKVYLGMSGINRFQAVTRVLNHSMFPVLFQTETKEHEQLLNSIVDVQEISEEQALKLIKSRPCSSVVGSGYSYQYHFEPRTVLTDFSASLQTQQRTYACFFVENWFANHIEPHKTNREKLKVELQETKDQIGFFSKLLESITEGKTLPEVFHDLENLGIK